MNETGVEKNEIPIKPKSSKLILILLLIIAATVVGILYYVTQNKNSGLVMEDNATIGDMPGVDMEQRKKELQKQLDESMIAFSINTSPVFSSGTSEGNLMIENPGNNAKLLVAEVYLTESNELIYTSKALKPGSYLENVKLDKVLEAGNYDATVYFKAYTEDTQEYIGQTGAAVAITVQN